MATSIGGAVTLSTTATLTTPVTGGTGNTVTTMTGTYGPTSYADGTGAGQADQVYWATRTLTASTSEQLDFAGSNGTILHDVAGRAIAMARFKTIIVSAATGNTNNVIVGGGSGAITGLFGVATQTAVLVPGATIAWLCSPTDTTGYVATAHALQIANSAGSTSVTYSIYVLGCSA